MTKINLKDIQHKIVVSNNATIDSDNYIPIEPRIGCKKVNLKYTIYFVQKKN
jgi:hypothetical protein